MPLRCRLTEGIFCDLGRTCCVDDPNGIFALSDAESYIPSSGRDAVSKQYGLIIFAQQSTRACKVMLHANLLVTEELEFTAMPRPQSPEETFPCTRLVYFGKTERR